MKTYEVIISKLINRDIKFKSDPITNDISSLHFINILHNDAQERTYLLILEHDSVTLKDSNGSEKTITLDANNNLVLYMCDSPDENPFAYNAILEDNEVQQTTLIFKKAVMSTFKEQLQLKNCLTNLDEDKDLFQSLFSCEQKTEIQQSKAKLECYNLKDHGVDVIESDTDDIDRYQESLNEVD